MARQPVLALSALLRSSELLPDCARNPGRRAALPVHQARAPCVGRQRESLRTTRRDLSELSFSASSATADMPDHLHNTFPCKPNDSLQRPFCQLRAEGELLVRSIVFGTSGEGRRRRPEPNQPRSFCSPLILQLPSCWRLSRRARQNESCRADEAQPDRPTRGFIARRQACLRHGGRRSKKAFTPPLTTL